MIKLNFSYFILQIFLFLFVFTTINRGFRLFGLDLRYFLIAISILLILIYILKNRFKFKKNKVSRFIYYFYFIILVIDPILFLLNFNKVDKNIFFNIFILNLSNFIFFTVIYIYINKISKNSIYIYILSSLIILSSSVILIYFNVIPSYLIGEDQRYIFIGGDHYNIFGQNFRISGFGEDANYTTLFSIIGLIILYLNKENFDIILRFFIYFIFVFVVGVSYSKTIILGSILSLIFYKISRLLKVKLTTVLNGIFIFILTITILPIILNYKTGYYTIDTRFFFWHHAFNLFREFPVLGGGLSSFRYYFNDYSIKFLGGEWIVHTHNTYISLLSEGGLLLFGIFVTIILNLIKNINNFVSFVFLFVLLFLFYTQDIVYTQIFVMIITLIQINSLKEEI